MDSEKPLWPCHGRHVGEQGDQEVIVVVQVPDVGSLDLGCSWTFEEKR